MYDIEKKKGFRLEQFTNRYVPVPDLVIVYRRIRLYQYIGDTRARASRTNYEKESKGHMRNCNDIFFAVY